MVQTDTGDRVEQRQEKPQTPPPDTAITTQHDSNIAKKMASASPEHDPVMKHFDPSGHPFGIEGAPPPGVKRGELGVEGQDGKGAVAPERIQPGKGVAAFSSHDGSVREIATKDGGHIDLQFNKDGNLTTFSQTDKDNKRTTIKFESGHPVSKETQVPGQEPKQEPVPKDLQERQQKLPDGSTLIEFSQGNQHTAFQYDKNNKLMQISDQDGHGASWMNFDTNSGRVTDAHVRTHSKVNGEPVTTTTNQEPGYEQTITNYDNHPGKFEATTTDQRMYTGVGSYVDTRTQRTDHYVGHEDGSADVSSKFVNDPNSTYKTHIGRDGGYETYRYDDKTHEKHLYEKGKEHRWL